jgi:hypothetical protein
VDERTETPVAWTWRYESADGEPVESDEAPQVETFPSQGDAESWLGEAWQELLHAGVAQVTLLDGTREVYGPMSLSKE